VFAVALLFSGQNATLTGTLAGQIVMEGFLNIRLRPWLRRLITRLIAIIPALITVYLYGERGIGSLLVFSQVVLSLQLSFAVFPLVLFTGDKRKMGALVAPMWMRALAWPVAVLIGGLNAWLLWQTFAGSLEAERPDGRLPPEGGSDKTLCGPSHKSARREPRTASRE
jgi:manganese transport protein